ncbi:MAG: hypothetical protein PHD67_01710 [Oscillospiraceae bacterium]|nr:hypothetical protein [Oscillospiraceae bacterium]
MRKAIEFRNFSGGYGVSEDYRKLHDFLTICQEKNFSYARLDWMITHRPYLEEGNLCRIGIWEEGQAVVATALFDTALSDIFLIAARGYETLYEEMIGCACGHMANDGGKPLRLFINDENLGLQKAACKMGFSKTNQKEPVAAFDLRRCPLEESDLLDQTHREAGYQIVS